IEPQVVGSNLTRWALRIARLGLEFVLSPLRLLPDCLFFRALNHDFVASFSYASECTIRVYQVIGIEAGVHFLPVGKHVVHGPVAQDGDDSGEQRDHQFISVRRKEATGNWHWQDRTELGVRETRNGQEHRQQVQPRIISTDEEPHLRQDDQGSRDPGYRLRKEKAPGNHELRGEISYYLQFMK